MKSTTEKKKRNSPKTAAKKKAYLSALAKHGTVLHASRAARINRSTVQNWRKDDRDFAALEESAYSDCVEVMELSMYKRGVKGDNTACIFWLKGARPQKYKDRVHQEVTGEGGKPIEIRTTERIDELRGEFLDRIRARGNGRHVPGDGTRK